MKTTEMKTGYQKPQETEPVEEKQSKPVDEDKSVISDKTLIAQEG